MNTTNIRELNHAAYYHTLGEKITVMLRGYPHSYDELASYAHICNKTLYKIRMGDASVDHRHYINVYTVLAEYHHYSNYKINSDLQECDKQLLEGRKEY